MASSPGEKLLAGEMLVALTTEWIAAVYGSGQGKGARPSAPKPEQLLGVVFLYTALAMVAMFGPEPARLAAGIGGLVLTVILLKGAGAVFAAAGVKPAADASPAGQLPGVQVI